MCNVYIFVVNAIIEKEIRGYSLGQISTSLVQQLSSHLFRIMAESVSSAEVRSRYEALKKDLLSALPKKRAIDKQLVREREQSSTYRSLNYMFIIGADRGSDTQS